MGLEAKEKWLLEEIRRCEKKGFTYPSKIENDEKRLDDNNSISFQWFIVGGAVLFLIILFLALSSSADDFFSPNVSTIVAHLNISENVAVSHSSLQ